MPSALLKFTNNMTAPSVLTLVEGNTLKLKLEGIPKAYVLKTLVDQTPIVTTGDTKHNARADSWQFEFIAKQAGLARISIISSQGSSALSISPSAITIRVEAAMKLPPLDTEEGMRCGSCLRKVALPKKWAVPPPRKSKRACSGCAG